MLFSENRSHERWVRFEGDTFSYITQIYLVLGHMEAKPGLKMGKLCPKNNIYIAIYREMGKLWSILTPGFASKCPKQGNFGWYIKTSHLRILPTSHVKYAPKITFIQWFIGRWARFYPFCPPVLPQYAPQTRSILVIYQKVLPLRLSHHSCDIFPVITFIPWFTGRWAFWPPIFPPIGPKTPVGGSILQYVIHIVE